MKNFDMQHTIRIYDPAFVAEIGKAFDVHSQEFKNRNEFLTELLRLGIKQMNQTSTIPPKNDNVPACTTLEALTEEIKKLYELSTEMAQYLKTQFKKFYVHIVIFEKLLAAIYNIKISELSGTPPLVEKVEDGFFDDLPMRLGKIIVSLERLYGLR